MTRPLHVLSVPYDGGQRDVAMGRGPTDLLERLGYDGPLTVIDAPAVPQEIKRTIGIDARLAEAVSDVAAAGSFPLVLAGNCNSALGTTAGVDRGDLGVIWFDAHADFDTPEDNLSGFFDVFALSILTGGCWRALRRTIPGFREIDEQRVVLVGVRDLERYQRESLERSTIDVVQIDGLAPALDRLATRSSGVYLHIDLDSLDPSEGRANEYAAAGGLTLAELDRAIGMAFERFEVVAAALTAYDPTADGDAKMGETAAKVFDAVARRV